MNRAVTQLMFTYSGYLMVMNTIKHWLSVTRGGGGGALVTIFTRGRADGIKHINRGELNFTGIRQTPCPLHPGLARLPIK